MSKEMENKLVPKLRFPEFADIEGWNEEELGQIGEFIGGGTPDTLIPEYWNGSILWYTPTEIKNGSMSKSLRTITNEGLINSSAKILPIGTILITTRATIGDVAITNEICTTNQGFQSLVVKQNQVNRFWFYWILKHKYELIRRASGSTFPEIGKSEIAKIKALHPDKQEQQKIADCLSSLDDLINAENEKLAALKEHKKGLMQQLFPAEGEKVPKLRFREFRDSGKWVDKELIKLTDKKVRWSFTGGPFGSNLKASDYTSNGIRIIQLQNIGEGQFIDDNKIYTSVEKADELLSCNIYSGDIILSKMGDPVGRACIIPESLERAVMASDGIRFVIDEKHHNKYFIYTLINSEKIREIIDKRATGSTRKRIGLDELKQIPLLIPSSKDEQKKIAELIYSLDTQIELNENRVINLKLHKKGLMQGLFPQSN